MLWISIAVWFAVGLVVGGVAWAPTPRKVGPAGFVVLGVIGALTGGFVAWGVVSGTFWTGLIGSGIGSLAAFVTGATLETKTPGPGITV